MSPPRSEYDIYMSYITVNVPEQFDGIVDRITFQTKNIKETQVSCKILPGERHKAVIDPAVGLPTADQLSVSISCQSDEGEQSTLHVTMDQSEIITGTPYAGYEEKRYAKSLNDIEIAVVFSGYPPAGESSLDEPIPNEILKICPRFRMLVIGNSGAGKSTLIKKLFGIQNVDVSHTRRGRADIERELPATNGRRFILHDTLGFEAAEYTNMDKVKSFINGRRSQEHIKDRLHAVWVCLAVPYAKGRFIEAGTEEFLRDRGEILGDIPIIVALTQADLLEKLLIMKLDAQGIVVRSVAEAMPHIEQGRADFLSEFCTQPLEEVAGKIPHVTVSMERGFGLEPSVVRLINMTTSRIVEHIRADPSYVQPSGAERDAAL